MKKSRLMGVANACVITLGVVALNEAEAITYSYIGATYNDFFGTTFDSTMRISGTMELAAPLAPSLLHATITPLTFSFNDGVSTITENTALLNTGQQPFVVSTDLLGNITSSNINLFADYPSTFSVGDTRARMSFGGTEIGQIVTCTTVTSGSCTGEVAEFGRVLGQGGGWSVVPIPAAIWLFGSGLIGLIGIARRKKA